jgi:hypothetical protein
LLDIVVINYGRCLPEIYLNSISGVMVSVLSSCAVDRGFETRRVKPKTIKLVFAAFPLSTQLYGVRTKIGWLRIRIMCPSGVTCLLRTVDSVS